MLNLGHILVIDDSIIFRDTIARVLRPHCQQVHLAASSDEALSLLDREPIEMVICDVFLGLEDGFLLLEQMQQRKEAPPVIMVSSQATDEAERRAVELGAIGFVAKPVRLRNLSRVWRRHSRTTYKDVLPRAERPVHGTVLLIDRDHGDVPQVEWGLRDVNEEGAFLETDGPVPIGTELDLELRIGAKRAEIRAVVVRAQEPSWAGSGGIGVRFLQVGPEAGELIRSLVEGVGGWRVQS